MQIKYIILINGERINRAKFIAGPGMTLVTQYDHDEEIEEKDGWFWQNDKKYSALHVVEVGYETKELEG